MNKLARHTTIACTLALLITPASAETTIEASPPQAVNLTIYDTGLGMVRERRLIPFRAGEGTILIQNLPSAIDITSLHFTPSPSSFGVESISTALRHDLGETRTALRHARGTRVLVTIPGRSLAGTLLETLTRNQQIEAISLLLENQTIQIVRWDEVQAIELLETAENLFTSPTLLWRAEARRDHPQSLRINYLTGNIHWRAEYELTLSPRHDTATLSGRLGLDNQTGASFQAARLRLIATEQALQTTLRGTASRPEPTAIRTPLRYRYRSSSLTRADDVDSLSPIFTLDLDRSLDLPHGHEMFHHYLGVEDLPMHRHYVYDGVVFDQFQRNRRSDWNYGTEFRPDVETFISFQNEEATGLGFTLAPGRYRIMNETPEGTIDMLGHAQVGVIEPGQAASIRLGPARGLSGERERVSYTEIVPHHEYDETFEIRLRNDQDHDVTIRVIEHLYRWPNHDIMRADAEYERIGDDIIQFSPQVKAGGSRTIRYTVRYRW